MSTSQEPHVKSAINQLEIDTLFTKAYLRLVCEDKLRFCRTVQLILRPSIRGASLPDSATSCILHLHILALSARTVHSPSPSLPSITISECIDRLTQASSNRFQRHDAAILEKCADHGKYFTPDDLPIASSSFYAMPKTPVAYNDRVEEPDHIVDWLDLQQLRDTDEVTRERINRMQAERGWPITKFQSYDSTLGAAS